MQLIDSRDIMASPEVVWAALLNPEVLKDCVPGCESMTGSAEDGFEAVVAQKVGPVSARFTGLVKLSDLDIHCLQKTSVSGSRILRVNVICVCQMTVQSLIRCCIEKTLSLHSFPSFSLCLCFKFITMASNF